MSEVKALSAMEATTDGDAQLLLIQKVRMWLDTWFDDPHWTVTEVKNAITYIMQNDELVQKAWGMFEDDNMRLNWDEDGNPVFDEHGRPVVLHMSDYINTKGFRLQLENWIRNDLRKWLETSDIITRMGAMNAYPQGGLQGDQWSDRTPWFYLKEFNPWGFGIVYGKPGSGKTDFAGTIMDDAVRLMDFQSRLPPNTLSYGVVTNIKIPDLPPGIAFTRSFRNMLMACLSNLLERGELTLCVLDELPQFFSRKRAMSKEYVDMEKMIFLLRKVGGNLIGIVQSPKDIPSVVEEFSTVYFYKMSRTTLMVKKGPMRTIVKGVPPTRLNFDTHDPASFEIDVDMNDLHGFIKDVEEDKDKNESVLFRLMTYLKSVDSHSLSTHHINNYIRVARLGRTDRPSMAQIGAELGISAAAVSNRCRKMRILDKQMDED